MYYKWEFIPGIFSEIPLHHIRVGGLKFPLRCLCIPTASFDSIQLGPFAAPGAQLVERWTPPHCAESAQQQCVGEGVEYVDSRENNKIFVTFISPDDFFRLFETFSSGLTTERRGK